MIEPRTYAVQLEKKLIDEFKEKFQEKVGYCPVILTRVETNEFSIPMMSLEQLAEYFDPFLPTLYDKKLTLLSKSRKREVVELRMMFCYLARSMRYTLNTVGMFLNGRDHTTVIHSVATFINLMETSEGFRKQFLDILTHIKENHEPSTLDEPNKEQHQSQSDILS